MKTAISGKGRRPPGFKLARMCCIEEEAKVTDAALKAILKRIGV